MDENSFIFVEGPLNLTCVQNFIKIGPLELFSKIYPRLKPPPGVGRQKLSYIRRGTTKPDMCAKFHLNRSIRIAVENLTTLGSFFYNNKIY